MLLSIPVQFTHGGFVLVFIIIVSIISTVYIIIVPFYVLFYSVYIFHCILCSLF